VIRLGTKVQLLAFLLITMLGVSVLSAKYVGLTERLFGTGPTVAVDLAQSGGIFAGSEVTYRGVKVGRVEALELRKDGVRVRAKLDSGTRIPKDTIAVVENRSAVGEQYLDFQPRSTKGAALAEGDVVPMRDTRTPIRVDQLLLDVDQTVSSVDREKLGIVVDELGDAFAGGGSDLQRLIDHGTSLSAAATDALPETIKLLDDGKVVLTTQRETASSIKTFATNFANLSETLRDSDPDLRRILDRGVVASKELDGLIVENQGNLAQLVANFITIGQITNSRIDGIEQMFVTYPEVVVGGFTVVPGDGTAHFGLQLNSNPPACTRGYEGTRKTDPAQVSDLPAVNTNARCTLPRGSTSAVRGAQNSPGVTRSPGSSFPMAYGNQPLSPGTAAQSDAPHVRVPVAPTEVTGAGSWDWILKEATQ
jgi:phospholipid/cholesterol/gamma-HCH transport system substrate-binding protein